MLFFKYFVYYTLQRILVLLTTKHGVPSTSLSIKKILKMCILIILYWKYCLHNFALIMHCGYNKKWRIQNKYLTDFKRQNLILWKGIGGYWALKSCSLLPHNCLFTFCCVLSFPWSQGSTLTVYSRYHVVPEARGKSLSTLDRLHN